MNWVQRGEVGEAGSTMPLPIRDLISVAFEFVHLAMQTGGHIRLLGRRFKISPTVGNIPSYPTEEPYPRKRWLNIAIQKMCEQLTGMDGGRGVWGQAFWSCSWSLKASGVSAGAPACRRTWPLRGEAWWPVF